MRARFGWKQAVFILIGTLIAGGSAAAQDVRPVPQVIAVDSQDKPLGVVIRSDVALQQMQIALEVDGELVVVSLERERLTHGARNRVYFSERRCRGQAFMEALMESPRFGAPAAVAGQRCTLFFGEPDSDRLRVARSVLTADGCQAVRETEVLSYQAERILDLMDEFTPPFEIVAGSASPEKPGRGIRRSSPSKDGGKD